MTSAYQPIVDTARASIVGYEGLARFALPAHISTEDLFRAARTAGRSAELEAACLRAALAEKVSLPRNCFLTVNVSPDMLREDAIREVWGEHSDLRGIIVELTEQTVVSSYVALEPELDRLRGLGALIAVDDVGSGYAGLTHLLALKPSLIKLDREIIHHIDADEAKRALVEMLGTFASRIDCWLLAEGIETEAEYATITTLGVPLAQGYYLARPGPAWPSLAALVVPAPPARHAVTVREIIEHSPTATSTHAAAALFAAHPDLRTIVLLDDLNQPVSVLDADTAHLGFTTTALRINLDTSARDSLLRAITREPQHRYEPLIVIDNAGRYIGTARIERLITTALG